MTLAVQPFGRPQHEQARLFNFDATACDGMLRRIEIQHRATEGSALGRASHHQFDQHFTSAYRAP